VVSFFLLVSVSVAMTVSVEVAPARRPSQNLSSPSRRMSSERMSRLSLSTASIDGGLDLIAMEKERKKLSAEMKSLRLEFALDFMDVSVKLLVVVSVLTASAFEASHVFLIALLLVALFLSAFAVTMRLRDASDLKFLVRHGFSRRWKKKERISGGQDPRVVRDAERRQLKHFIFRTVQAWCADLPWIVFNVNRVAQTGGGGGAAVVLRTVSIAFAGFGFGMKFAAFVNLVKMTLFAGVKMSMKEVWEELPADVKCGVGHSDQADTAEAMREAFKQCMGQIADTPSFMVVTMTADHDHRAGLDVLAELAPNVPYSGSTTCRGTLIGDKALHGGQLVAVWGIYDPEGFYSPGIFEYTDRPADDAFRACKKAYIEFKAIRDTKKSVHGVPSFVWVNGAPDPEDRTLAGFARALGEGTPVVGGSSADNDISGKWKQWCSLNGGTITSSGCSFTLCFCSAVVQGQLFTGYNATGKKGVVTQMEGTRKICTIDNRPAIEVYNEWTGGHYTELMKTKENSNILAESSLYPLGQVCGQDEDGEPFYRSIHPSQIWTKTGAVQVFSDVKEGESIVMMSGTKENVVNRIAGVASHIVRTSGFSLQEARGSLVIFCAGAMMFAGDSIGIAAQKLNTALGGTPYMGMHTFGEQGMFPDGLSRHGNLMFSALVVSSRRRIMKVLNVDTGRSVMATEPEFERILAQGCLHTL